MGSREKAPGKAPIPLIGPKFKLLDPPVVVQGPLDTLNHVVACDVALEDARTKSREWCLAIG